MIRWNNDYNRGAHPSILKALEETNETSFGGYGIDDMCSLAATVIKEKIQNPEADIHFLTGGTQVNFTLIASALRPFESVICADSGHINAHETGAVENTGHKIQQLKGHEGKITASQIAAEAELYRESGIKEHITCPRLVFISFPTEYGTIYSKKELEEIKQVCVEYNMYLYIDGARLGYGLGAPNSDLKLKDIAKFADAFYIGGTKCGALFGEALVITNPQLKPNFRSYIKQNGAMLAKGWIAGLQFYTLLKDSLYLDITREAVNKAQKLKKAFQEAAVPLYLDSPTNQQFVILSNDQMEKLGQKHVFEYQMPIDQTHHCVRFCTSWSTTDKELETLISDILSL